MILDRRGLLPTLLTLLLPGPLGGCPYVFGINHAPELQVQLEESSSILIADQSGKAVLVAAASDPDGHALTLEWTAQVQDSSGEVRYLTGQQGPDNTTPTGPAETLLAGDPEVAARLILDRPSRGAYLVTALARDALGATRSATASFVVANTAPQDVVILVQGEEAYAARQRVPDLDADQDRTLDTYPGHARYLARVDEARLKDFEGDLRCGKRASVKWSVTHPGGVLPEYSTVKPCQGSERLDRLRFRFAPGAIDRPARVRVQAVIDDGMGATVTAHKDITLQPNRPPCIPAGGATPAFSGAAAGAAVVPVLSESPFTFLVHGVSDDVLPDRGLTHVWSIKQGKTWTQEDAGQESYTLAPGVFGMPGEEILLRVELRDEQGQAQACAQGQPLCAAAGAALPASCYQWVTWRVRFQ